MNELTTIQTSSTSLQPLSDRTEAALTRMLNGIDRVGMRSEIPAALAPTPEQRAYLAKRAEFQDRSLMAAGVEMARMEIGPMFDVMKIRSADEIALTARIEIYAADIASLPAFALAKSCADYRQGIIGDGIWAPTPGEIRKRAMAIAEPIINERARIRTVLTAEIGKPVRVDESKRAAALAFAKQVADEMRLRPDPLRRGNEYRPPTRKEAEEWLEREKANPRCPDPSPALRAILGLPEMQRQEGAA